MKKLVLIISLVAAIVDRATAQDNIVRTPKGAEVKILTKNPGDKIKLNDVITFHVIQKSPKDSVLFSSYTLGHPLKIQVQQAQNVGDLMDVLILLTAKDSAYVKIPSDSVFKGHEEQRPAFLPKGSTLSFTVKIEQVQSLADAMAEVQTAEVNAANKYIADHKLAVTTTASGLKYIITQPSARPKPAKGDTALVNYTGRTLDGKVFDSSIKAEADKAGLQEPGRTFEPLKVIIGTTPIIKGWDEGLQLLNEGSKAQFIIPSALAYGAEGAGSDIGPYSTLLFDIELVKIKPAKHAGAAPAHPVMKAPAKQGPAKKKS
jgi:FKBP-type peptidyl-prolyl cis-trans isomerase FkpA